MFGMKNTLVAAIGLALALQAFSQPREKTEDDQYMQAQTYHMMFATEREALGARARLEGYQGAAQLSEFKRLAREISKDPGSSRLGGDLGLVKEGEMVRSFEDALFTLPENTLSQPVKTEFGWHLIYATQIYRTPVSEICERSLGDTIRRASPADRGRLQETVMLLPSLEALFSKGIADLLGDGWGSALRDSAGNLVFMRVGPVTSSKGTVTVTMHKELAKAVLTTSPLACKRSERVSFAVNCGKRSVVSTSFSQFEGRAALGRRLVDVQVPADKQLEIPLTPGSLALQLVTLACGAEASSRSE